MLTFFVRDNRGTSAPEYAVMVSLIVSVCLGTVQFLGNAVNSTFQQVANMGDAPAPVAMPSSMAPDSAAPPQMEQSAPHMDMIQQ